jgi:hypothetical protein
MSRFNGSLVEVKKDKFFLYYVVEVQLHALLSFVIDRGEWSASHFCRLIPGERAPGTHWVRKRICLRTGLDAVEKKIFNMCS